ncbi:MAG: S41 family peptidase [Saprospiraceae bacterium]|nr:S41 family peptidase [Saprospiraceae bacterium]
MHILLKYVFLIFFCTTTHLGLSQAKLDSKSLQEDFSILSDLMIGISPNLKMSQKVQLDSITKEKLKELENYSMTSLDFLNFYSEIDFSAVNGLDEHASLFLNKKDLKIMLEGEHLFPIPIKIIGKRLVVNSEKAVIPYGSFIDSINGEYVGDLLQEFNPDSNTFRTRRMEQQFPFSYVIKKGKYKTFKISYSQSEDKCQTTKLNGIGLDSLFIINKKETIYPLDKERLDKLINTSYFAKQDAYYLQLNSFSWDKDAGKGFFRGLRSDVKNFEKTFDPIFDDIAEKKAKHLIIDLRYNTGGNIRIPATFYSYIAKKNFIEQALIQIPDFVFPHKERIVMVGTGRDSVQREKQVDKFIKKYQRHFEESDSSYLWEYIKKKERQPKKNAFQGKVYLLVGGYSVSASSIFTALFKSEQGGTIVGEQLGGSHHDITAGTSLTYLLPNTKIKVEMPLMLCTYSEEVHKNVPERKILPDVQLSEKEYYNYVLHKKDPELEKVLELINTDK